MKKLKNNLYWKLSLTMLALLMVVGFAYVLITVQASERYFEQKVQRLNAPIAEHLIKEVKPFVNGEVNKEGLDHIMHSMMAINPSIEVYLLDVEGKILSYVAPYKKIKLEQVALAPILSFLATEGKERVLGDDPRNPGVQKVFSAAAVEDAGKRVGYVYIVLASEEYDTVSNYLRPSYFVNLGGRNMALTLIAAMIIGLLAIWLITRNLRTVTQTVQRFRDGDLYARVPGNFRGELSPLAGTFNDMADKILEHIRKKEALEKLRRELIANVSHDLRTPVSVVQGYIETLSLKDDTLAPEERKKYLQTTLKSIEKLSKLVTELFELSKLESQQVEIHKEPFSISELVQDIVFGHQIIAQEKGITINPVLDGNTCVVNADIALIERVLQNLLDNAIKFTSKNGIIIVEAKEHPGSVEIKVIDSGIGIPKEEIPYIFDRFHMGDPQGDQAKRKGSGLGLAIVDKILKLHDTVVKIESTLGQGTEISFRLPLYTSVREKDSKLEILEP